MKIPVQYWLLVIALGSTFVVPSDVTNSTPAQVTTKAAATEDESWLRESFYQRFPNQRGAVDNELQVLRVNLDATIESSPTTTLAQVQTNPSGSIQMQPNLQFNVQRQAGNCPQTVGLWMFMLGFEGGADHTVIANTQAIASAPAKLVVSQPKRLEYQAPLRSEYASCVGQASSEQFRAYDFQFRNGKVSFRMDMTWMDGYTEILYKGVSASRPYIHWRATE